MNFNIGNAYTAIFSSDNERMENYKFNGQNVIYVIAKTETAKNTFRKKIKEVGAERVFFEYFWGNGARFSNAFFINESCSEFLISNVTEKGTMIVEEYIETSALLKEIKKIKTLFILAKEILKAKEEIIDFKKSAKRTKKEIESHPAYRKSITNNADFIKVVWENLNFGQKVLNIILLTKIHYFNNNLLVLEKINKADKKNHIDTIATFYDNHKDFFESESDNIGTEIDQNLFRKKSREKNILPMQHISVSYLKLRGEITDYNESDLLPKWENDSLREVEKPVLPLPNAHMVNALTSGLLQGELYTDRGDALIKGSTVKVIKRKGSNNEEEFFENRQMVFYKDEYILSREKSSNFIESNLKELNKMLQNIGSVVDPTNIEQLKPFLDLLAKGNRVDLPGQVIKTIGNFIAQQNYGYSFYNGEPGIGKTQVSFSVCRLLLMTKYTKGMKTLFVTDGAKHLNKMSKEAKAIIGDEFVTIKILRNLKDVDKMIDDVVPDGKVFVYVVSKDTAKRDSKFGTIKTLKKCPNCGNFFTKKDTDNWNNKIGDHKELWKKQAKVIKNKDIRICSCGEKIIFPMTKTNTTGSFLWSTKKAQPKYIKEKGLNPKESFGKYLRRKLKWNKLIDFLIIDEAHNMSSDASNQTQLMRDFIKISKNKMLMTGTLSNGYSSSLYYLLYAVMPKRMKEWGFDIQNKGLIRWIDVYGARKKNGRNGKNNTPQEKAVINPALIMHHLAPFTIWGKIEDLNYPMPKYSEDVKVVPLEKKILERISDIREEAITAIDDLNKTIENKEDRIKPSLAGITKAMLYVSNNPFKEYSIPLRYQGKEIVRIEVPKIYNDENFLTAKEESLIEIIKENLKNDRKVMIYTYFNETALANIRIAKVLEEHMPSLSFSILGKNVKSENLDKWFEVAGTKYDVVIVPYKRVATGLDIPQYPEIVFYEEEYNIREIIQASRRPYRAVIQKKDVHITHLCQEGVQAVAMHLISEKIAASKIVEGEVFSDNGVESFAVDSIEIELAQRLSKGLHNLEVPDFATTKIEEGRARPWTELEQTYIDTLEKVNPDALALAVPEKATDVEIEIETEVVLEEESLENLEIKEIEEIEFEPIEFGFEILTKGKHSKKTRSGKLKNANSDLKRITEELSANEKVQLTFF